MNFSEEHHEYDYSCRRCGKGYYAEVGFSLPPCCGILEAQFVKEQEEKREKEAAEERKLRRNRVKYDVDFDIIDEDDERPW